MPTTTNKPIQHEKGVRKCFSTRFVSTLTAKTQGVATTKNQQQEIPAQTTPTNLIMNASDLQLINAAQALVQAESGVLRLQKALQQALQAPPAQQPVMAPSHFARTPATIRNTKINYESKNWF
jgi:hypothetical protein